VFFLSEKWAEEFEEMATAGIPQIWLTILLAIIICLFSFPTHAKYSGGRGVPNDQYQIATTDDLKLLGETPEDYDEHFILTDDIDLNPNLPCRQVFGDVLGFNAEVENLI